MYVYKIHDTECCFFVSRDHAAKVTSEVTTEVVKSNVADGVPHCGLSEMPDDLAEPGPEPGGLAEPGPASSAS